MLKTSTAQRRSCLEFYKQDFIWTSFIAISSRLSKESITKTFHFERKREFRRNYIILSLKFIIYTICFFSTCRIHHMNCLFLQDHVEFLIPVEIVHQRRFRWLLDLTRVLARLTPLRRKNVILLLFLLPLVHEILDALPRCFILTRKR